MGLNSSCNSDWCVKPAQMFCECSQKVYCQNCFTKHMSQDLSHRGYSVNQSSPSLTFSKLRYLKSDKSTEVYEGLYKSKEVIIKLQYFTTKSDLNRKQEESALQRSTKHPNICKVLKSYIDEQFTEGFKFVMIMEKADKDLEDEIRLRIEPGLKWQEEELINYLNCLIDALALMQKNDMAHRDIKPANILLFGSVMKLADFGLSIQEPDLNMSNLGVVGTFMYLSPKLMKAYKDIESGKNDSGCTDHNPYKSDVYSLGLTFLYMCSLTQPNGLNFNIEGTTYLHHRLQREIGNLNYSRELKDLLKHMLQVEEENRPDFIELEKIVQKDNIEKISKIPVRHSFNISEIPAMESVFETCNTLITIEQILSDTLLPGFMKSALEAAVGSQKFSFSHQITTNEADYIKILTLENEIKALDLTNCQLAHDALNVICLGNMENIESLILGKNKFGRKGAKVLKNAFWPRLQVLRLWNCGIGNKGVKYLCDIFNDDMVEIFLGDNKINDSGAKTISRHLPTNLKILSLCDNLIGDEGARSLAIGFNKHKAIQQIYLDHNRICAIGLKYLLQFLPSTLKSLRVVGNEADEELLNGVSKKYKIIC